MMRRKPPSPCIFTFQIFICLLPYAQMPGHPNFQALPVVDSESEAFVPVALHLRNQGTNLPSSNNSNNGSLLKEAKNIINAAQEESRVCNARLRDNPRTGTNYYNFHVNSPSQDKTRLTGTAVNKKAADAAALLAEALVGNASLNTGNANIVRQASSYGMSQMTQNGQSPFVPIRATN